MSRLARIAALALLATATAAICSSLGAAGKPLAVTSSIDGKKVLPQQSRWLAYPNVAPAQVAEVDYLIDGKLRWVEEHAPYNYASDDLHGHLGYLYTSWLAPGPHTFTARVKTASGQTATDKVTARVLPAPTPPAALAGRWSRSITTEDQAKSDPKFGTDNVPPAGRWRLIFDRVGVWEIDPRGGGIVTAYSVGGSVLHAYAPIQMVPRAGQGAPGHVSRFGARIDAGGGIECNEAGPFGTYRWTVIGNELTLTAIHELCGQRRAIYEGTWTRAG
jgi:hypothetical protein